MNVTIRPNDDTIDILKYLSLCHDENGNVFLYFENEYHWLFIDEKDDLNTESVPEITALTRSSELSIYKKIKHTNDPMSLKGKLIDELEKECEEDEYDEDAYEEDEDIYKTNFKYYPEDKHYYVDGEKNSDSEDDDDLLFSLSRYGDDTCIKYLDHTFDAPSLYDTFIINTKQHRNAIIFTLESNQRSSYRITINDTGLFVLNIVGHKIKYYDILYDGNKLKFKSH